MLLVAVAMLSGCTRSSSPPQAPPEPPAGAPQADSPKWKITAYINVTSGCQAPTVELLRKLAAEHQAKVDLEIVDFGSPEGADRWRQAGLDCMSLLFNDSPVLRFPGTDETPKVVVFFMPAGFSWTHEDLQDAFDAIEAGKAEVLTEEQAREELQPRQVEFKTEVHQRGEAFEVQVNGTAVLELSVKADDKSAAERAGAVKSSIEAWSKEPLHENQLSMASRNGKIVLLAKGKPLVAVTQEDAKAAGVKEAKQLGMEWLGNLKQAITDAPSEGAAQPATGSGAGADG